MVPEKHALVPGGKMPPSTAGETPAATIFQTRLSKAAFVVASPFAWRG
jgi:hypothetical protein